MNGETCSYGGHYETIGQICAVLIEKQQKPMSTPRIAMEGKQQGKKMGETMIIEGNLARLATVAGRPNGRNIMEDIEKTTEQEMDAENYAMSEALSEAAKAEVKVEICELRSMLSGLTSAQKDALILLEAIVRETFIPEKVVQAVMGLLEDQGYEAQVVIWDTQPEFPPHDMVTQPIRDGNSVRLPLLTSEEITGREILGYLVLRRVDHGMIDDQEFSFLYAFAKKSGLVLDHMHLFHNLHVTKDRLRRAVNTLREMSSFVGHEVRAPLTSVSGFAGVLEMQLLELREKLGGQVAEEVNQILDSLADYTDRIHRGASKLAQATMLLGTVDISPDTVKENVEGVEIAEMVLQNTRTVFEPELFSRKLLFSLQIDQQLLYRLALVNKSWFSTIFDNTIGNAIKYALPETCIHAHLTMLEDELVFELENAIREPVASDRLNRLLEKGYRAQDGFGQTKIGINQGLGLYFVNLIVKDGYGGSIKVMSDSTRTPLSLPHPNDNYKTYQFGDEHFEPEVQHAQFQLEIRIPLRNIGLVKRS